MGGKGDSGSDFTGMQPVQTTIDTNTAPLDLTQRQEAIDVQRAARNATAQAPNPGAPQSAAGTGLGDTAAQTLSVPDFLRNRTPVRLPPGRRSRLVTTDEPPPAGGGGQS